MRSLLVASLGLLVACGSERPTTGADAAIDADPFRDAPATSTVQLTVSGTARALSTSGSTPLAGVLIHAYRNADETTPIATTTSDAQGNYTITVQTMGESIDGFLKATKDGYKDTYLYPPYPLMADFSEAAVVMVTQANFDALDTIAQGQQQPESGFIGMVVTDGATPVAGATVASVPSSGADRPDRYNEKSGDIVFPSSQALSTYTDGVGYLFNVPPGQVTVSAAKTGVTFSSHKVTVRANVLTTTVVVP